MLRLGSKTAVNRLKVLPANPLPKIARCSKKWFLRAPERRGRELLAIPLYDKTVVLRACRHSVVVALVGLWLAVLSLSVCFALKPTVAIGQSSDIGLPPLALEQGIASFTCVVGISLQPFSNVKRTKLLFPSLPQPLPTSLSLTLACLFACLGLGAYPVVGRGLAVRSAPSMCSRPPNVRADPTPS